MIAEAFPLFPLQAVLMPGGRMPLQIFEPRYLDLVSRCMREGTGFGVVRLVRGQEVLQDGDRQAQDFAAIGTEATIVDWDALPHNRLKITIEGGRRFRVREASVAAQKLTVASVEWLTEPEPVPLEDALLESMLELLEALVRHPALKGMGVSVDVPPHRLAWVLSQYLPLEDAHRYELLSEDDGARRVDRLHSLLRRLGGERDGS